MKKIAVLIIIIAFALMSAYGQNDSAPIEPKCKLEVEDVKNDGGTKAEVYITPQNNPEEVDEYNLKIFSEFEGQKRKLKDIKIINNQKRIRIPVNTDNVNTNVIAEVYVQQEGQSVKINSASVKTKGAWFDIKLINSFVAAIFFISLIMYLVSRARKGGSLFVRKIPGLEEIDNAVGRATEMGKPVFYIPGLSTIRDVATIASLNILRSVGQKVAHYATPLKVLNRDPVVLGVAQEVVHEAYLSAGRPDLYNEDDVYFAAGSQFAFASVAQGAMVREKPGAVFLLGMFWAESLILAETANSVGAIQIAGTDATAQIPFFIASCDYTLIGEELYAASAYLSRAPKLLGTLKAQDYFKAVLLAVTILALITNLIGIDFIIDYILK
ncbi:MAG: hypothetical protein FXF47_09155 [Candidatus Mcinerneyibacterium aminivorans]|uniref:DUF6754 domain-containing protein n=1 Tax=Candidatus Mcinerneyibacterium aminivorans TaxID=2703815 RepID=A0A5D0MIQ7_9BACT|nr:MAG: hypothetical protein FXF47_09155 [Candidatus Mcinerneyibacterium aminivorans]